MSETTVDMPKHIAPKSGAELMVGYRIDLSDPSGSASVTLEIEDKHLNRNGTLHGGIHTMMMDAASGFAASRHLTGSGDFVQVQTLSLNTSYVASVSEGTVVARGHVVGGGYKIIYAMAEIQDAGGRVLSTASGVFKRIST